MTIIICDRILKVEIKFEVPKITYLLMPHMVVAVICLVQLLYPVIVFCVTMGGASLQAMCVMDSTAVVISVMNATVSVPN